MDLDVEGLYNVHKLQGSHDVNDQKRLIKLLNILSSENGWTVCASLLTGSSELPNPDSLPEVQKSAVMFLCCRAIEDYLKSDSPIKGDEPHKFAEFILHWVKKFINSEGDQRLPKYLEAKASQLICLAILRYYPHHWASLFDDLLSLLTSEHSQSSPTLVAVDLFLDTLLNLDAYLVSRELQLTTEEVAKGNEIKDSLRVSSINSVMGTCYQLVNHLLSRDVISSAHIKKTLRTVGLYATWVDLNLVAGAEWVALLGRLLQLAANVADGPVMRAGVYAYLTGIVNKGMPAVDKLMLINGIWDQLGSYLLVDTTNTDSTDEHEVEDTLLESLCGLTNMINAMGLQLIDVYRLLHESGTPTVPVSLASMTTSSNPESLMSMTLESMEARLNMAIHLFQHKEQQVGHPLVPFLRAYLGLLKSSGTPGSSGVTQSISGRRSRNRNSSTSMDSGSFNNGSATTTATNGTSGLCNVLELTEPRVFLLKRLLFTFIDQLKSLPLYSPTETGEDEYEEYRHDLRTLIGNVIQLDAGFVLGMIFQMVKHAVQTIGEIRQSASNQSESDRLGEIDATLSLFYLFGETCKAPKNDHFTPSFPWSTVMSDIMRILCSDAFLNLPHWVLQLQYFEIMARYDHYFALAPEHLFQVMVSLVDHRGLHSPWRDIRKRCPYLIARLIKTHKKTLAPHAEELLSLFSDLLPLCLEPDLMANGFTQDNDQTNGSALSNGGQANGSANAPLGLIEQGFLYEAAAQLIAANGSDENSDRIGQLSSALLNPVLIQYHQLVEKYAEEKDPKLAEVRGNLVRQAADLITRTIRVFYQPKSSMIFGSQSIVLHALNLMVEDLTRFPTEAASPGRASACAGVRAFLHRMIASSAPSPSGGGDSSDLLLTALIRAVPQLVKPLEINQSALPPSQGIWSANHILDAEQRWKEIRDIIPLFVQVISRFKTQSATFLSACLPDLFVAIGKALAEPLPPDHPTLAEERKLLRRGYLQLVENIGQFLPQAFFELLGPNIVDNLSSVLVQTEACIEADDPLGLRSSLMLFCQLIQTTAIDPCFYQEFLLPKFVPFCVIAPTRTTFRLSDAQFGLALNELANCLHHLAKLQDGFATYLHDFYLPQQQLSPELIQSYVVALKSPNVKDFQTFIRNFYAAFR